MTRTPVKSSQVKSVGYDPVSKTLEVEFHARGEKYPESVYQYSDVSPGHHAELMKSRSVGSHFHAHIRGKFAHKKIA